jgi:hypothetical protein
VPEFGQLGGITDASQDGLDDLPARAASDVADDLRQLQVHLLQGFLHVLGVLRGVADQVAALPQIGAQLAGLLIGPKGSGEQADAVEAVDPLAVPAIGLGAASNLLGVTGIDQQHLEAVRLEQFVQRNPVDARRFHGDRGDLMLMQIGQQRPQTIGVRREFADVGRFVGTDADPVRPRADVYASSVGIGHRQTFETPRCRFVLRLDLGVGRGLAASITAALPGRIGRGRRALRHEKDSRIEEENRPARALPKWRCEGRRQEEEVFQTGTAPTASAPVAGRKGVTTEEAAGSPGSNLISGGLGTSHDTSAITSQDTPPPLILPEGPAHAHVPCRWRAPQGRKRFNSTALNSTALRFAD